jgi:hypothetical protein
MNVAVFPQILIECLRKYRMLCRDIRVVNMTTMITFVVMHMF